MPLTHNVCDVAWRGPEAGGRGVHMGQDTNGLIADDPREPGRFFPIRLPGSDVGLLGRAGKTT